MADIIEFPTERKRKSDEMETWLFMLDQCISPFDMDRLFEHLKACPDPKHPEAVEAAAWLATSLTCRTGDVARADWLDDRLS